MVKVFAAVKGAEIRVEGYGVATDTEPVLVPSDVARELIRSPEFKGESKPEPKVQISKPVKGEKE